jgi:hypothetical protein
MSTSILSTIQTELNSYGYPICMILGNIGNVLIVIVFSRYRQNACSVYLICSAIMNDLYLIFSGFVQMFPFSYLDKTISAFVFCKTRYYLADVLLLIAKTMIILACIDRFMTTSSRATFRAVSTLKRAKWLVFFSFLFWPIVAVHTAVMITITNGQCGPFGIYSTIYTIYTIILIGLIPPIILSIFGYLTYHHMKQLRVRVQPIENGTINGNIPIRRRDRELLIIVLSEVFVYIVTTSLYPLIILELMISQYVIPNKSFQYLEIEFFIINIAVLLLCVNSAAPFYIYLMSSKSFQRDFKRLIINVYRKLTGQPIIPIAFETTRTRRTVRQQDTRV